MSVILTHDRAGRAAQMLAVQWTGVPGLCAATTLGAFDPVPGTAWQDAGERLLALLAESFPGAFHRIVLCGQVHGNCVAPVPAAGRVAFVPECDGLVAAEPGVAVVVRTADCQPVVLADAEARVCAALHAGWQGTMKNIAAAGIAAMESAGAARGRIAGWIGPGVCGDCYEVSPELADEFRARHGSLGDFSRGRLVDLPRLNALQARAAGAGRLEFSGACTLEDGRYHSHRRSGANRGQLFTLCGWSLS